MINSSNCGRIAAEKNVSILHQNVRTCARPKETTRRREYATRLDEYKIGFYNWGNFRVLPCRSYSFIDSYANIEKNMGKNYTRCSMGNVYSRMGFYLRLNRDYSLTDLSAGREAGRMSE
jgi:hypothetical protein